MTFIFGHTLLGQMAINTTPLALGTKSNDLFETIGQPLIGNTTSSGVTLLEGFGYLLSTSEPTVTLADTDSDNIVSNSNIVTITATFSKSMAATPTISLSGIGSDLLMSATSSDSVWTYTWTVSTSVTSTTATVSGTDLYSNAYSGTESIIFNIDNIAPEIKMLGPTGFNYVGYFNEHFYFINDGTSSGPKKNWNDAKTASEDLMTDFSLEDTQKGNGGLLDIDSSAENNFIGNYLNNIYSYNSVWTGIYQENDNSNWKNRLGQNQTYFSWRSDQPTGTNQNVVLFTADPSAQGSSFTSESNVWTDEEASNTNDYIVEIDNFYFEDNANSTKISLYANMETLNWSLSGDDASFFEIDDSYTGTYAHTIFIDFKSQYKGTLNHSNPQDANSDNIYSVILSVSDVQSNTTSAVLNFKALDTTPPTVILTDTDSDKIVSNSDVVTITATFSESMAVTPTISLSGIASDILMSATGSASVWEYVWTVSTTVTSTIATVSGTDLAGEQYSGTESITFTIDQDRPYVVSAVISNTLNTSGFISFTSTNTLTVTFNEKINEPTFTASDVTILPSGYFSITKDYSIDDITFVGYLNVLASYSGIVTFTINENSIEDLAGNLNSAFSTNFIADNTVPTLTLTDTDSDNIVSNSDVVTITATFSESMAATPTFSLSGIVSNAQMSATTSDTVWTYTWTVSTTVTSTTATVSGTDLAGNAYSGTDSITFTIDNTTPTVTLTDTDSDNIVSNSDVVTITATFSESMSATPTLSLSGITSNAQMSATTSDTIWTYAWTVSGSTVTTTTATVSGTDLSGNAYAGMDSITFTIDNSIPTLLSFGDTDQDNIVNNNTNVTLTATFSEPMLDSPAISISGLVTNTSMTVSASTNSTTWTYLWDVPAGNDGTYFATVSATDLIGNSYSGTESITFIIDNTAPEIESVSLNATNDIITLTFSEATFMSDAIADSVTVTDTSYYLNVTTTGGIATVLVDEIRYNANTDDRVYYLDLTISGTPDGNELVTILPASASRFKDRIGNYASDTSQTSNTLYLTNSPPRFTSTAVNSSNTSITIIFSEGVTAGLSGTELSNTDFTLSVSGGTAVLASSTPPTLSKTDSTTYVLSASFTTEANGSEILTVTPISTAVFDSNGTQIVLSTLSSNTVQLNDLAGPSITEATIDSQNRYVDLTFSEGIYATASPATAVTSSSFTLLQQSGPSYGMTISNITTTAGGVISGGETTLRFNLAATVKPTGQEVFMITATDSTTVVDAMGNAMTVSQTNNSFQLKPPTSGGVSPEKSTIVVAPLELIGNGINTAIITVQAKDSIGQNFLEGGYSVTLFGPSGDLTSIDNQDGTYSAIYLAETPNQDSEQLTFGFRVAGTEGTATTMLTVYRDEDGDGVYNINDECPGTEAGSFVDEKGCALNQIDTDGDGVFDDIDECPDTPEFEINNVKGTPNYGELIPTVADEKGCGASQRDTDDDGIVDTEDNCIDTQNPDQADKDGDGIGDVCDTDNPIPQIESTELTFVQLPPSGLVIGKIKVTDPDGDTLSFTQTDSPFSGILSIDSEGNVRVVTGGGLLEFGSVYNGNRLTFTVSDGYNEVSGSVIITIQDAPRPPEISIITFEISEDAEVGTIVGFVEAIDPMGGEIVSIALQGDGFIELDGAVLKTTQELDYETTTAHPFTITAQASDRADISGLTGSKSESIRVVDIPNQTYTGRFFISIFNVIDEELGAKVDHRRYFNPNQKAVGKWKVRKKISGGEDADKFTIKTRTKLEVQKDGDPVEEETEDYLDFIIPPDFENPGDANGDNVYEVDIEYTNTDDGAPEVPIVVTQTNIQVPEGKSRAIELQAQPVLATDDNDGDGIVDILDNSPLVANPDQSDSDGDGVGDVTDDADHDGVWNPFDICPDTPLGELVDLEGCLIYYLPAKNFSISKTEKCAGENSIGLTVQDTSVSYNVSVSGAVNTTDRITGSSWSLDQLSAGVYSVCVTVEGVNPLEFERCFEVTISEPDPLVVSSFFSKSEESVSFDLSGGTTYQITQNGKTTQTSSSKYTVQLEKGINNISISTGIECQGLFENSYLNSYEVKYTPNPFKEELQLFIGGKDNLVEIGVYAPNGQLVDYRTVSLSFGMRSYTLETTNYKQGVYIIKVKGQTLDQSLQVIKE
ncbi:T9SS type A sorting domain-containing protein [Flavobacteriaceae bacterium]|nr:T9SS type A sorting domain-containing protein [Flavobacteriaceae bacterium]